MLDAWPMRRDLRVYPIDDLASLDLIPFKEEALRFPDGSQPLAICATGPPR